MTDLGSLAALQTDIDAKVTTNGLNENTGARVNQSLENIADTLNALITGPAQTITSATAALTVGAKVIYLTNATLTLPASPVEGTWIHAQNQDTTNSTIDRNGKLIDGAAANIVLTDGQTTTLRYTGGAWYSVHKVNPFVDPYTPNRPDTGASDFNQHYFSVYDTIGALSERADGAAIIAWILASVPNPNQVLVVQVAHGFAVGDVIRYDGANYAKARADTSSNAEVVGMVSDVTDVDNFTYITHGFISGLSGLTAGVSHFLSPSVAGTITDTDTSTTGEVSKPVLVAVSTTTGNFVNQRGIVNP